MSNAPKPEPSNERPGRGPTSVPPRGGKARGPANRAQANRNARSRQARQAAQRRNRLLAGLAVVVVVAVIAVVVILGVSGGSGGTPRQPAPVGAVQQMQGAQLTTMTQAANLVKQLNFAQAVKGGTLTEGGKPVVLYIGAEFCPVCAAERWPMVMALMKFGQFSGLKQTHSAVADGNAGTWSFYGATYTSPYLVFKPYELYTNQPTSTFYKTLEQLPKQYQSIWAANEGTSESFPFIDFGGKEALETAQYNPSTIYNQKFEAVLGDAGANDNTVGASINASAAVFTKYLCGLTNNQPANVCSAVAKVSAPVQSSSTGTSSPAGG